MRSRLRRLLDIRQQQRARADQRQAGAQLVHVRDAIKVGQLARHRGAEAAHAEGLPAHCQVIEVSPLLHALLLDEIRALLAAPALEVDIDAMAHKTGMSRRHFTRLFRRQTGMNFAAWRQQACLLAALTRLGGGAAVTTVAREPGYASARAFSAAFRRTLGTAPSRYLAMHGRDGAPG